MSLFFGDGITHTLAIIKPDAVEVDATVPILQEAYNYRHGLRPVALRMEQLEASGWATFYEEHSEQPFYTDLITFMASGPCVFIVFTGRDAIETWREMMGATDPEKARVADPCSLRARYGTAGPANAVHGSDSPESVLREIATLTQLLDGPFVSGVTK